LTDERIEMTGAAIFQLCKVIECPSADGRSERIEMTEFGTS
jgi:hypothetical protein